MFSFVTVYTAINLYLQSISYIDNRDFPGTDAMPLPGPLGYQTFICANALNVVPSIVFSLNTWLADGLLVGFMSNSVAHTSKIGRFSSFTAAVLLML